jgi:hypothetical protein
MLVIDLLEMKFEEIPMRGTKVLVNGGGGA